MPMAPCTACAIGATSAAASLVRALASAARSGAGSGPAPEQPISAAMRAAATCSAITASWCWIAWNLPIDLPNCDAVVGERDGHLENARPSRRRCSAARDRGARFAPRRAARPPSRIAPALPASAGRRAGWRGRRSLGRSAVAVGSTRQPSPRSDDDGVGDAPVRRSRAGDRAVAVDMAFAGDRDRCRAALRDAVAREQRAREHRLRDRQRHRVAAFDDEQRERVGQAQARAAGRLGHQRVEETRRARARDHSATAAPPRSIARTRRRRAGVGEQALERLGELVHRSPSPRAIRPRSTSRVPPRSENVGANCVM